ncbi:MAG: hypothetical protein MJB14_07490 [Spirochaetes bacterium]|nr:hypothetical protein [Spirochaetota bacterium]
MKRLLVFILLIFTLSLSALDFQQIDNLIENKQQAEAKQLLDNALDLNDPDPAIVWRIGWVYYEYAVKTSDKDERISQCDQGIAFLKKYYNMSNGIDSEKAKVRYWFAVLSSKRAETIGIFESLGNIPNLMKYCQEALELDPDYGEPYFLMAMIYKEVPFGQYGDKWEMGSHFSKAFQYEPETLYILVDGAYGFYKRNWDVNKKKDNNKKRKKTDGTPENLTDREYAKQVLQKAIALYESQSNHTIADQEKYQEAKSLLKKL